MITDTGLKTYKALKSCQKRTLEWAAPKGLLATDDATKQALYIAAEAGELIDGVLKNNIDAIKDGIGDTAVTLANYSEICTRNRLWVDIPNDENWCAAGWGRVRYDETFQCEELAGMLMISIGHICQNPNTQTMRNCDAVRFCYYALATIADRHQTTLARCWALALDEIEGRTGQTVDGVFVKDGVA